MSLAWFKSNWRWSALNVFALAVLFIVLTRGNTDWNDRAAFDSMLASGKWAIRFLLGCLAMTPLNMYFGWREAVKLRKPAGLWAFGFALLHILFYIRDAKLEWLTIHMPFYLTLGLVGISILSALAATSNRWSMQRLGKNWKHLHRLVYLAGMAVATHGMLATMMSKKIHVRDPEAPSEIKVYIAILCVLLVVRIPLVRQWLIQISNFLKHYRRSKLRVGPEATPEGELWPRIYGRESSVSVKPTFMIPNTQIRIPEQNNFNRVIENVSEVPAPDICSPREDEIEIQEKALN
jgi:methionine sulfoxide reductase heme-binding subunit